MGVRSVFSDTAINTTVNSSTLDIRKYPGIALQAVLTGTTVAGTLYLQVSNDDSNWETLTSTTFAAAGTFQANVPDQFAPYVRLRFVDSGTTSANARINATAYTKKRTE